MFSGYWRNYLITCFSLVCAVVDTTSDVLYQPQNLSVSWNTKHFSVTAQWSRPMGVDVGCTLQYTVELYSMKCPPVDSSYICDWPTWDLNYTWNFSEAVDAKCIALLTKCENQTQNQTRLYEDISPPQELVKDVRCSYYAKEKMNCTWDLSSDASDLLFSYGDNKDSLKPCAVYIGNSSKVTGCHLYGEEFLSNFSLYIHFNGTHDGHSFQNIFLINPRDSVTSQPPQLNITRDNDHLVFQSNRPDFKEGCWVYMFRVNKCNEVEMRKGDNNWSLRVPYDEACKYTVQVQANYSYCGTGQSDWSEPISYGTNNDPNWKLKAIPILIPLIISVCFIVAIILFQRYKDNIFPKIPEPSLLCRDMLNAEIEGKTKDLYVHQLYEPPEERFEQKIRLELDAELLHVKT